MLKNACALIGISATVYYEPLAFTFDWSQSLRYGLVNMLAQSPINRLKIEN